jgi:O-acetyl-ADP-ribose deacetylase (regulator of RNase III)
MADIIRLNVHAIFNAANNTLLGGCPTGEARITKGYRLPARWIIHTVSSIWQGGGFRGRASGPLL